MEKLYTNQRWLRIFRASGLALAILLAGSFAATAQMSGSYTINKNSAASATNFQSFDAAVDALNGTTRSDGGPSLGGGVSGAVTITVAANSGPYTEKLSLSSITGASSSNRITFDGNNETLQYDGSYANMETVRLNGTDYVTIKNLTIRTIDSRYAWGVRLYNNANYNIIENCDIDITSASGAGYTSNRYESVGIILGASSTRNYSSSARGYNGRYNVFKDNYIHGKTSGGYGMYIGISIQGPSSTGYDTYTEVLNNEITGFRYYGIYHYYSSGAKINGNEIHRKNQGNNSTYQGYGIYNYYAEAEIIGNKIHDLTDPSGGYYYQSVYGIYCYWYSMPSNKRNRINNNQIYSINDNGYYYYGIFNGYANSDIYHNTVAFNGSTNAYRTYGIYAYDYLTNSTVIKVYNNIVYLDNNATDKDALYFNGNTSQFEIDYNSVYKNGGNYAYFNGNRANLSNWQSYNGGIFGQNSFQIDPNFIDEPNGDLQPQILELDGSGDDRNVAEDALGNTRNATNPDIGSVEYDIPINVSAITFPTSICQGDVDDVEVTITNNSTLNLSDFKVAFSVNNVVQATETFTGTINAGQSATYAFNAQVTSNNLGNYELKAMVVGKAPTQSVNYTVNPSPIGSQVIEGSVFEGSYNTGDGQDPDIVAYGDNIVYDITPPTNYTNADFGSTWTFDHWTLSTPNGTAAGSTATNTDPGANDGNTSFTPVIGQSDSTFVLSYAVRSLTNGCIAPTVERTVFVAPRPVAAFQAMDGCDGDAIQFDNNTAISSGSVEYLWRFGDGDSTVLINPSHTYAAYGTYNVELVALSNYGYEDVAQGSVTVFENPTAEFSSTNVCEGSVTPFQDASIIPAGTPSYSWDFGDGSNLGSGNAPTHQYNTPGVYEVTMIVTANGCSGTSTNFVTYAPRATVDFVDNGVSCNNEEVSFTNQSALSSGSMGYRWDFNNDGSVDAITKNPRFNYASFGTFDVKLTVTTDFGCSDDLIKQITLAEGPQASFTNSTLCNVENVDFTNTSVEPAGSSTGYEWTFSDGSSYSSKDISKTFNNIGEYTVTLTATSTNGCQDIETTTISVDEDPTAQFYTEDVCDGNDVELNNASSGNNGNINYAWDLDGDGSTDDTDMNVTASLAVGSYDITLTATTPGGCEDQITKTVSVFEIPSATVSASSGQTGEGAIAVTVNGTDGADVVVFMGDGGRLTGTLTGGQFSDVYSYPADGLYDIEARVSKDGCDASTTTSATVFRTGVVNITNGELKAYPNPTSGKFTLDLSGLTYDNVNVAIYSSNGQLVATADQSAFVGSNAQLDLTTAPAGVYLVKVTTDQGVYNARITLNK